MPPQDAEMSHRNPLKQSNKTKRVSHSQATLRKVMVVNSLCVPISYLIFQIIPSHVPLEEFQLTF